MNRTAVISPCGTYRYSLARVWNERKPLCGFICLNPSTADANNDDPTIRRLIGFAGSWGYGGFYIGNLFAFRSPSPRVMKTYRFPVGPDNDAALIEIASKCEILIAAWGKDGKHLSRDITVRNMFPGLKCLSINSDGTPQHPLYLPKTLRPMPYKVQP